MYKILCKESEEAERIKIFYGSAIANEASDEGVYLDKVTNQLVKEKEIVESIESSLEQIITDVRINTNALSKNERLPIILSGGVANTPLIAEKFKMFLENQILDRNIDLIGAEDAKNYYAIGALLKYLTENE